MSHTRSKDTPPEAKTHGSAKAAAPSGRSRSERYGLSLLFALAATCALLAVRRASVQVVEDTAYALCTKSGAIYTVDESKPIAECILVHQDRIVATGSQDEVRSFWINSFDRREQSLKIVFTKSGHIVIPGLADSHAHILQYGFSKQLRLEDCNSVKEIVKLIEEHVLSHPDVLNDTSRWIEGMGWDQNKWGGYFPKASDLSSPLLDGRPISLSRVDIHASWVSSRVLELMGDLRDKVDGGDILRDSDGKPTGVFIDNAMDLIPTPPWSEDQMKEYFTTTMEDALRHGLASIHDAGNDARAVKFYERLADEGALPIRLYIMGMLPPRSSDGDLGFSKLSDYGKHGRLNVKSIKLFMDGALGSWGAALLAPYTDNPGTKGILRVNPKQMKKDVQGIWEDGWQVNIHCIGDRANQMALDIFEDIIRHSKENASVRRPRIEHAQIMSLPDLHRIEQLGVIASVQPTHATSDMWYAEQRLGPERIKGAYAWQDLLNNSPAHLLPLGSDFPVEGINPLLGFYAAVTRLSTEGKSPHGKGGWYPEQRLSRSQALKGMTLDAAYASFTENITGSLLPGKKADFVVLNADIMTIPAEQILSTKVVATVIDGKAAYGSLR